MVYENRSRMIEVEKAEALDAVNVSKWTGLGIEPKDECVTAVVTGNLSSAEVRLCLENLVGKKLGRVMQVSA